MDFYSTSRTQAMRRGRISSVALTKENWQAAREQRRIDKTGRSESLLMGKIQTLPIAMIFLGEGEQCHFFRVFFKALFLIFPKLFLPLHSPVWPPFYTIAWLQKYL